MFIVVYNESEGAAPLAEWDVTQTCGLDIYLLGAKIAQLQNRVNVHDYQDAARTSAKFNWDDMAGTKTFMLRVMWTGLNQTSSPKVGVKFL